MDSGCNEIANSLREESPPVESLPPLPPPAKPPQDTLEQDEQLGAPSMSETMSKDEELARALQVAEEEDARAARARSRGRAYRGSRSNEASMLAARADTRSPRARSTGRAQRGAQSADFDILQAVPPEWQEATLEAAHEVGMLVNRIPESVRKFQQEVQQNVRNINLQAGEVGGINHGGVNQGVPVVMAAFNNMWSGFTSGWGSAPAAQAAQHGRPAQPVQPMQPMHPMQQGIPASERCVFG